MVDDKSLGGMAKKWLRAQSKELLAKDRHERESASVEGNRAEHDLREKATEEAFLTAIPGLRDLKDKAEAHEAASAAEREQRRLDEMAARPLAGVGIGLTDASGGARGSWAGQLPAKVRLEPEHTWDDEGNETQTGESLVVELDAHEHDVPLVGGTPLYGWRFLIPGYTGPGTYDLSAICRAREDAGNGYDYTEFCVGLGGWDEPLYWTPDTGQGTVEVGPDGKALVVRMRVEGAGDGPFDLVASVNLP